MRVAIRQIHVYAEAGGGVPGVGEPAGAPGILESPRVGGAGSPGEVRLTGSRDRGVAWVAGRVADDVVTLRAIGSDPVALRRGVFFDEGCSRRRRVLDGRRRLL